MKMVERILYSIAEVSKMLGVSDETVRRMIAAGQLKAVKVRQQWRISKMELEKYLGRAL
jgi:excisionase family DNA binding protein